jgi:TRAP transporter TatT component family protein
MKILRILTFCVITGLILMIGLMENACSPSKIASDLTSGIFKEGAPIFEQEGDIDTAEVSGLAMIKTLEVFNFQNPSNKNYLNLLARSYATYAFGFFETRMVEYQFSDQEKYNLYVERAKGFYKKGKAYGMDLLRRKDGALVKALGKNLDEVRKRMKGYDRYDVEPVFWTAFNWGSYINMNKDDITIVADLPLVEAMMARIVQVYPGFYYGAPYLFYGVYYASRPAMLGGDPKKALENFENAAKVTEGRNLMVYALEAQFLAVQTMDRSLFDDMLSKINAGSVEALPAQRLACALAKQRAKYLQDNASHYF